MTSAAPVLCVHTHLDDDCCLQDPAAVDLLARVTCDPTDVTASEELVAAATQHYERLLPGAGRPAGATATAAAGGASDSSSKGRSAKRQKKGGGAAAQAVQQQADHVVVLSPAAAAQVYQLYCAYLQQRMEALLGQQEDEQQANSLAAAAVAQQLLKVLLSAHTAGAADEALYALWVQLATQLRQNKVSCVWGMVGVGWVRCRLQSFAACGLPSCVCVCALALVWCG